MFAVTSSSQEGQAYVVRLAPFPACTCPAFRFRGTCKHLRAVLEVVGIAPGTDPEDGGTAG